VPEYKIYPRDIWDYIKDLPYMPSRADREKLFWDEKKRERIKLWDYFFRIKPEDVGKPQREEILSIIKEIRESVEKCKQKEKEIRERINELDRRALLAAIKRIIWGSVALGIILFLITRISTLVIISTLDKYIYSAIFSLAWLIILIVFVGIRYITGDDKKESRMLALSLQEFKKEHFEKIDEARKRINALKKEIARLRRQVPKPLSGPDARKWLNLEFQKLWNYAKTEVALVRDIIKIQGEQPDTEIKNPLSILGPAELQEKIPRQFLVTVNGDLHKHLGAKQAYQLAPEFGVRFDVLYGVYFLEYIVVATDMLVTHSFFYDFIDDKVTSEYTTEQYYTDVVALAIEKESRKFTTLDDVGEPTSVYIEDSPTFTLSLRSGEIHQVSFVSQDYFEKVRDKLEINPEDVGKIYWINQARTVADNVIEALRSYIRKHKTL
jgi:hypothetical protein